MRVLYVESDQTTREAYAGGMRAGGHDVIAIAADKAEVKRTLSGGFRPDVVVFNRDASNPTSLFSTLREEREYRPKALPVILTVPEGEAVSPSEMALVKPVPLTALLDAIQRVCSLPADAVQG